MASATSVLISLVVIFGAYIIGSISFAVIVSRLMGLDDPRTFGSGNPGATNVLRTGNKKAAIFTLVGDALKGWVAVFLATLMAAQFGLGAGLPAAAALAAFLGHVYPIFLKFKGGKGVATALGVLAGLEPVLALATLATWLIVAYASRYSSLAAVLAAIFAPLYYLFGANIAWRLQGSVTFVLIIIAVVLCYRHSANITRLMKGTEPKIGKSKGQGGKPKS
ncbi:glycerol-3-phosphate 1-O-acyltransferase PlsY [Pusillimonas sp. DMV24BSW_D]|uniref:glycerol-3-phosphate 1-O-acyltransferase PlsY n=1 Tax=Neopusillimonas aestuarii TaxID=2716226 RepID=UPI00140BF68E|nr:glycerol-3-phosphate 1-O-acyltransferase PlsY [Pusillimonas sp. DMV24BSW_D]QIM49638.1 glycerol-3-phosphate 1-O-acyltransferase PlsY [Pusillimonas sp. DMV24BSW_D]